MQRYDEIPSTCLFTIDARVCNAASCWKDVLDELSIHATSSERKVDKLSTGMRTLKQHSEEYQQASLKVHTSLRNGIMVEERRMRLFRCRGLAFD